VQNFETRRLTKDGMLLDMSVAISAIRDATGTVTAAATVARDVTETHRSTATQRALEAQLRDANGLLDNLAGALRRDLQDAHRSHVSAQQESPMEPMPAAPRGHGPDLTARELEVLELMAHGLLNKQIATRLDLRLNTVRNHSQSILYKLRAHSRLEAVSTAVRDGIISHPYEALLD
jgi:DNA-binding NarL/FixJ family response regulator